MEETGCILLQRKRRIEMQFIWVAVIVFVVLVVIVSVFIEIFSICMDDKKDLYMEKDEKILDPLPYPKCQHHINMQDCTICMFDHFARMHWENQDLIRRMEIRRAQLRNRIL
jgi:hypothetical protein